MVMLWLFFFVIRGFALEVLFSADFASYYVAHDNLTLFSGETVAVFCEKQWHAYSHLNKSLQLLNVIEIEGNDQVLGAFRGYEFSWQTLTTEGTKMITRTKNFLSSTGGSGRDVMFEVSWPNGAKGTALEDGDKDADDGVMLNWPAFSFISFPSFLSWEGSFVQPVFSMSKGRTGGPTVFYNNTDPLLSTVIVGGVWGGTSFKSFSSGNGFTFDGTPAWAPGPSGRIEIFPPEYTQVVFLHQGQGLTKTVAEWGQNLQQSRKITRVGDEKNKLFDITLTKIGYQTDNGAMYCFCNQSNCSDILIKEMKQIGTPMGYLSFQGAGASTGRGEAAPWCVERWGVDGGLGPQYPLNLTDFQKAIGIPFQLYAPYFCPNATYFNHTQWQSVRSNTSLPNCEGFDFINVIPAQSYSFYSWFFNKGITQAQMISFEPDFMNQNYNCIASFVNSTDQADEWLRGMADAAMNANITLQWCFATPTDILTAIDLPAVTNFRVSYDFCYGASWDIGISSLFVWAVGGYPSKDTFWTTTNNHTAIPGCDWTPDHEEPATELHFALTVLSTGPVGVSDAIGMTNGELLKRGLTQDGTILKPLKAVTSIDATYLHIFDGYVYSTFALGPSWIFLSFKLTQPFNVRVADFFPAFPQTEDPRSRLSESLVLFVREYHAVSCENGTDPFKTCLQYVKVSPLDLLQPVFTILPSSFANVTGGTDFAPLLYTVWTEQCENVWLLGELEKYVALSPVRFSFITCDQGKLKTKVVGTPSEVVSLTVVRQQNGVFVTELLKVVLPHSGAIEVDI